MVNLWRRLSPGSNPPSVVNVVVEVPKGSQNKYEYHEEENFFKLDRVLFSPLHYPGDYGFIPRTMAGDPLDALILVTHPNYPGIVVESRPIGLLRMIDSGVLDDKIICVPVHDPRFDRYKNVSDVDLHVLKEIAHFFQIYKELEGKSVEVIGWMDVNEANKVILSSLSRYSCIMRGK